MADQYTSTRSFGVGKYADREPEGKVPEPKDNETEDDKEKNAQ